MASSSKLRGAQDRISELPDAILCHILSFLYTREAVKTSVLSHRWNNVWASVPNLDLNQNEMLVAYCRSRKPFAANDFTEFVDRVLLLRGGADIRTFRLCIGDIEDSRICAWIYSAIRYNVAELDLHIASSLHHEIPRSLFMCNTLVSLKMTVGRYFSANTPSSVFFPHLKLFRVTLRYPNSDIMEKLFSCCPALEDLGIDGDVYASSSFSLCITALKLKRLKITFSVFMHTADDFENPVCRIFINANVPNLEELELSADSLVSYSLKNVNCLRKAQIGLFNRDDLNSIPGLSARIKELFAGICSAKYLTVLSPGVVLDVGSQLLLPTFNSLKHLELQLHTCGCLKSLPTYLKITPKLEHLKISSSKSANVNIYCNYQNHEVVCTLGAPEPAPICLSSHLKTICLWEFKGCPNEMEMAKYLVKHGKELNKVTIYTPFCEKTENELQFQIASWSKFSKFPKASKTCEIEFRIIF